MFLLKSYERPARKEIKENRLISIVESQCSAYEHLFGPLFITFLTLKILYPILPFSKRDIVFMSWEVLIWRQPIKN